ncbi:MAG: pimeloyl-CoA dehydrogenase small subunit [Rhodobiaceae bacterium]|jgi:alkylation response protein AidB-like acyl-CoA dehydrogenase|nr:pimeloyl-CoA dehydrogenase small subunit [Rhodobiaceae bacterium]|tara:strand:+ start:2250 stop:3377 length:1128 start_codon:yes stop_codon:yes gene_type:complete
MDFSFSEEQTLLRNTIQSFIQDNYDFDKRTEIVKSEEGMKIKNWKLFSDLGLLGLPFSEDDGGLGFGPIELMIVVEEFGKGLVVEPYIQTIVTCGGFLKRASEKQRSKYIPKIISGEDIWAFAYAEPQGRYNLNDLTTKASKEGDNYILNGYKCVVSAAPWSKKLIVSARTSGDQRDEEGISLFILDKDSSGISLRDYPTVDGSRASEIILEDVKVSSENLIGEEGKASELIEQVVDESIAAVCAEAIGAMSVLNETTVEYCKTRKQFGQPIGKFQVLQHRMVDMFMQYEQSVSMTYMVNLKLHEEYSERRKAASGAKVQICKAAKFIGQSAIQLHGGMGMTDELNVGHYFKRLSMIENLFGNIDHHLKKYASTA